MYDSNKKDNTQFGHKSKALIKNTDNEIDSEASTYEEINILKKLLYKIWGVTEILQSDVNYIKRIYTKPVEQKKQNTSREERIANLKHKLLTSRKKRD